MTDLGIRVLVALGQAEGRHSGRLLADRVGTTTGLLPQVMQPLVTRRWVRSVPGPSGGYELVVDLASVSLLDAVEAIEGPLETGECVLADQPCPAPEPCPLHQAWVAARDAMLHQLEATTLASLTLPVGAGPAQVLEPSA